MGLFHFFWRSIFIRKGVSEMVTIIKTEFMKLKRYFIVWIGVSLMLLTVLLTLFTTMADDGMVWDYQFLFEQVVKHFVTMIFPMCITLISGYMISREYTDDTLKNNGKYL